MKHAVLRFGEFAREALEEQARRHGSTLDELVSIALLHHVSELDQGRQAPRVPRFLRSRTAERSRAGWRTLEVDLDLDDAAWGRLRQLAVLQRIRLERLIEHAVWCYLADLDSGLVTVRIFNRAEGATG
jgi:hypothetical protein